MSARDSRGPGLEPRGSFDHARLAELDRRYVWHPFTQMRDWIGSDPLIIAEARGVRLVDTRGREYYDGNSSMWVNLFGHRREEINQAIGRQLDLVAHSTLLGLANVPAAELAERLVHIAPPGITKVFYSDNGSTAVEVALKMAFGYWHHRGCRSKTKFVALRNSYHGDTLGSVSLGGVDLFHSLFRPLLFGAIFAPSPYCYRCPQGNTGEVGPGAGGSGALACAPAGAPSCALACAAEVERLLEERADEIAAVVLEPAIQAAGGMITLPEGYLRRVAAACKKYGVLLILDEVATGFGRTGKMFACQHEGVTPDIMAVAKGITGGYLPLAATLTTEDIFGAYLGSYEELKTFFHGHSYTGNQLACAAALACLDIFDRERILEGLPAKVEAMRQALETLRDLPHAGDIRQAGMMAGIELVTDRATRQPYPWEQAIGVKVCLRARELGLITRPLAHIIVLMPPLAATAGDLREMAAILRQAISDITEGPVGAGAPEAGS